MSAGIQPHRGLVLADRLIQPPLPHERRAQVQVEPGRLACPQRRTEVLGSFIVSSYGAEGSSQVPLQVGQVGHQPGRRLELRDRGLNLPRLEQHVAETLMRDRVVTGHGQGVGEERARVLPERHLPRGGCCQDRQDEHGDARSRQPGAARAGYQLSHPPHDH